MPRSHPILPVRTPKRGRRIVGKQRAPFTRDWKRLRASFEQIRHGIALGKNHFRGWNLNTLLQLPDDEDLCLLARVLTSAYSEVALCNDIPAQMILLRLADYAVDEAAASGVRWTPLMDIVQCSAEQNHFLEDEAPDLVDRMRAMLVELSDLARALAPPHDGAVLDLLRAFHSRAVWDALADNLVTLPSRVMDLLEHPTGIDRLLRDRRIPLTVHQLLVDRLVGHLDGRWLRTRDAGEGGRDFTNHCVRELLVIAARSEHGLSADARERLRRLLDAKRIPGDVRRIAAQALIYAGETVACAHLPLLGAHPASLATLRHRTSSPPAYRRALSRPSRRALEIGILNALDTRGACVLDATTIAHMVSDGAADDYLSFTLSHPSATLDVVRQVIQRPHLDLEDLLCLTLHREANRDDIVREFLVETNIPEVLENLTLVADRDHVGPLLATLGERFPERAETLLKAWTLPMDAPWSEDVQVKFLSSQSPRLRALGFTWLQKSVSCEALPLQSPEMPSLDGDAPNQVDRRTGGADM